MGDNDDSKYSYRAKFSEEKTVHIDIKKKEIVSASEQSSSVQLTIPQICALYLAVGSFLMHANQSSLKRIKVFRNSRFKPIESRIKVFEFLGDSSKVIDLETSSREVIDLEKSIKRYLYVARFKQQDENAEIKIGVNFRNLITATMQTLSASHITNIFHKPITFRKLRVFFAAIGDFLYIRGIDIEFYVNVWRKQNEKEIKINYNEEEKDAGGLSSGSENVGFGEDLDSDDGFVQEGDTLISLTESDDEGAARISKRKKDCQEVDPFPDESDEACVSRAEWSKKIDVRQNIFQCIKEIKCDDKGDGGDDDDCSGDDNDKQVVITTLDSQITKRNLLTILPEKWVQGSVIEWACRYIAHIATGGKYQLYNQLIACHPMGKERTLIFSLFYKDKFMKKFQYRDFCNWFSKVDLLLASKWLMPVWADGNHYFLIVISCETGLVQVYDSIRKGIDYYKQFFEFVKKTTQAAAQKSKKSIGHINWTLEINESFPPQIDGYNCGIAMLCCIFDQLAGGSEATSREDYVDLRKKLAEVMYRSVLFKLRKRKSPW